jgi:SAM-dependent methyltransferase
MAEGVCARSCGTVFDEVAGEYDRSRPTYPDELVDRACEIGGLESGDAVLEVGCGTGQLTRSLVARGLHVTALEPGQKLVALAAENVQTNVEFVRARFEDARLPRERFRAVFCAAAFHWLDPDVSWQRAADALVPGGMLALIQYFGLRDDADDQATLRSALDALAPEVAARWPDFPDLSGTIAGVEARAANVAEAWAWLGSYDLARDYAASLFSDVRIDAVPMLLEHTATELRALIRTMSFWARLSRARRDAVASEIESLYRRLGRPIRSSVGACVVTARQSRMVPQEALP